jgi:hypothetical protein
MILKLKTNILLYLLLLGSPLCTSAQAGRDTIIQTVTAPAATQAVPVPVYVQRKFDPKFKERYDSSEFNYHTKIAAKSAWTRFWEWVGDILRQIFSFGDKAQSAPLFVILIRLLAILLIGFVVYLIVRAILNKEGMWIFGKSGKKITVSDLGEENIHEMNFSDLIANTKKDGDYRLAVRYYYLWVLKKLSAREIIDWHWDKTNSDYLYEIKNDALKKDFEYLSYVYDYSWYGDFPVDEYAFARAERAFLKTINTL